MKKIDGNDPYYPQTIGDVDCPGVTIRLHLAESAMAAIMAESRIRGYNLTNSLEAESQCHFLEVSVHAFDMADAMIERANREGDDAKT